MGGLSMNKRIILCFLLLLLTISGCSKREIYNVISDNNIPVLSYLISFDYQYQAEKYADDFFTALSEKDEDVFCEKMRELFSRKTQNDDIWFELSLGHLYNVFDEQTVIEYRMEPRSEYSHYEKDARNTDCLMVGSFKTDHETYYLKMKLTLINEADPSEEGITGVELYSDEDGLRGLGCQRGISFFLHEKE